MSGPNVEWLDGLNVRGIKPGLESITALLGALNDPQKGLRTIHVAGSDGKGSVCCMLESILIAAGYLVLSEIRSISSSSEMLHMLPSG